MSEWGNWGQCSDSCHRIIDNPPTRVRLRQCVGATNGGNCNNECLEEIVACNVGVPCVGK